MVNARISEMSLQEILYFRGAGFDNKFYQHSEKNFDSGDYAIFWVTEFSQPSADNGDRGLNKSATFLNSSEKLIQTERLIN